MAIIEEKKFVSSTELKNNTKTVLDTTDNLGEVFIMNNNKPRAVLISVDQYNSLSRFNDFRIVGDVVPMSDRDAKIFEEAEREYEKWEYVDAEEVFAKLGV